MITPDGQDRHGEYYAADKVTSTAVNMIAAGNYFNRRAKAMNKDLDTAKSAVEDANAAFNKQLNKLIETETKIAESAKKIAGKVKDSTQKLAGGLASIEKQANFDRLERYVELLERAEKSMSVLAELEKSGKLEKIAVALK